MSFDWISIASPLVSVAGACASWYWARRKLTWDAGKELGAFRGQTIDLLRMAMLVGNGSWRQVSLPNFSKAYDAWQRELDQRAPTIGRKAYREILKLIAILEQARSEFVGLPLGGLEAEERLYREDFDTDGPSHDTWRQLSEFRDRLTEDRHFLTR